MAQQYVLTVAYGCSHGNSSVQSHHMTLLTDQAVWQKLDAHYANEQQKLLTQTKNHVINIAGLSIDYSRNHLDDTSLTLFCELAQSSQLDTAINQLLQGDKINASEHRSAWHTVLRDESVQPDEVKACYQAMRQFAQQKIQHGITDIIHIGIGGSYLGTRFLYDAFAAIKDPLINCHFIANQHPAAIQKLLAALAPQKTMVIIVSKSFTTTETLTHGRLVTAWLQKNLPQTWQQQLVAVTADETRARKLNILPEHIFPLWRWIGGRFSLWSAVSLSIIMSFGWEMFDNLRSGAKIMDQHFQSQAWKYNAPIILAFVSLTYRHFFNAQTQAIIPYHNALTRLLPHLQQLHMESLGKQVTTSNQPIHYPTGAIIWGGTGPGSQHSFHQLLLQGHDVVPVDFIMVDDENTGRNGLVQATALLTGNRDNNDLPRYQHLPGNRPSTLIKMPQLTAECLGALLAMYEHKVFTQSILWNINAFDQWGVEASKQLLTEKVTKYETAKY